MSTWASVGDVAALYEGTLPARTQSLLDRAERELTRRVRDLLARLGLPNDDPDRIDQGLVKDILVDAVIRVLRNPKGFAYERDGDYGYGYGSENVKAAGGIVFTDAELEQLRGVLGDAPSPTGSILLSPGIGGPDYPRWQPGDPLAWTGARTSGVGRP